jgi:hypothetical protein
VRHCAVMRSTASVASDTQPTIAHSKVT